MFKSHIGHVDGSVRLWLRLEGLAVFLVGLLLYAKSGAGWGRFAALILVPDLALGAYLVNARVGAVAYNLMHSHGGPLALAVAALLGWVPAAGLPLAYIWAAHGGIDRALGYGLKYASAFGHTHLGRIGNDAARAGAGAVVAG